MPRLLGAGIMIVIVSNNINSDDNNNDNEKSAQRRRKHCALAVVRRSQKFRPAADPFPGARDGQNLISWRWSLPLTIQTQFGEDRCTQFRVMVVTVPHAHTHTPTHTHTNRQDRLQYTAPQCNNNNSMAPYGTVVTSCGRDVHCGRKTTKRKFHYRATMCV